jgi:PIN domain nuclease of toxin-antitoxin system
MRLLIDTQSFIWFFEANEKLPVPVRTIAIAENMSVISSDNIFKNYPVGWVWREKP